MKLENPWKCDECGALKQPSNGWYVGFERNQCHFTLKDNGVFSATSLIVSPWDSELAELHDAKHLCGVECVGKFVAKSLVKDK